MNRYFKEIDRLRKEDYYPVYYIYGPEIFLINYFIRMLEESFLQKKHGKKITFLGAEHRDSEFIQELHSISMFESKKLIVYKEIPSIQTSYRKDLLSYLEHPGGENILVLTSESDDRKPAFMKKLISFCHPVSTESPSESELGSYVKRYVENRGCTIEPEAVQKVIYLAGDSLTRIYNEIEKVLLYMDFKGTITVETVSQVVQAHLEYSMPDLLEEVGHGNLDSATRIGLSLLDHGVSLQYIFVSLTYFFKNFWIYNSPSSGEQKMSYWQKKQQRQFKAYRGMYSADKIAVIFGLLARADKQSKSLSFRPEDLLVPLLYKIMR